MPGPDFIDMEKVSKYENFLNEVLRVDLKTTLDRRDELYNEIAQYIELQTIMGKLSAATGGGEDDGDIGLGTKLKTRVDIGSNFYVQAEIPSTKTFTVDIGCGIWLQMTGKDALKFCDKKLFFLNARADELTQKELSIKAQIKMVLEGLREIQKIVTKEPTPRNEL
ncbi:protein UXT [Folsomia candida]|uniref:protein UXT n=1 Tax=Folsomia candida TaxID=158441 RepID=UPI000B906058|nr:protein UXT [Folsomia candida]XP_035703814.1 protein UXT [Folsomia candida]